MVEAVKGDSNRILKYFIWYAEASNQYRFPAASLASGKCVGKGLYVLDLKGFSLGKHFNKETREFIKAFSKMGQDNYPEVVAQTYIVNAPFIFKTAWTFAKNLIDQRTVEKFKILGGPSDYMPKLLEVMDRAQIPQFLGGDECAPRAHEPRPRAAPAAGPSGARPRRRAPLLGRGAARRPAPRAPRQHRVRLLRREGAVGELLPGRPVRAAAVSAGADE